MLIFVYQFGSLSVNGQPERVVERWPLLSCSGLSASNRPARCRTALPGGNQFLRQFAVIQFSILIPSLIWAAELHPPVLLIFRGKTKRCSRRLGECFILGGKPMGSRAAGTLHSVPDTIDHTAPQQPTLDFAISPPGQSCSSRQ